MSGFLNFSKLKVGQQVLGVVKAVNDLDMCISLPNQLTGFVTCDRISPSLTAALASIETATEIPSLTSMYQVGELVVASIVAVESPKKGGTKRRLELSLIPETVNKGIEDDSFVEGIIVVGEVCSHEDRGYTVSFGTGGMVGFLPDANTISPLSVGKTVTCIVTSSFQNRANRVITLSLDTKTIAESIFQTKANVCSLRCGTMVQAEVKAIKNSHLTVSFSGHEGKIDVLNLPDTVMMRRHKDLDLAEHFPVGKKITARIMHVDVEEKKFLLSAKTNIVGWKCEMQTERIGERVEGATVYRIDVGLGVALSLGDEKFAYAHISRLSDEHVEKIEGAYKVGSRHLTRLIDFDAFSGIYQASLQPSILKESILRIEDVHPGQIVRGQILKVEAFGVVVSITDRIRAICPKFHLTEVQTDQALKSYHVGQKYKFRVVDCDPKTRRITLTRKKGLLDSTLPVFTDYLQLVPGNSHDGYIVAIRNFGCIVRFYGEVKGIVTVAEMTDEYVDHPQDSFFVGQVVRCRIVKGDANAKELTLSLRKRTGPKSRPEGSKPNEGERASKKSKITLDDLVTVN
ncbi:hypothetical protein PSACC_02562 [Paramicrosporidium saccamoebae]|uniref:S1 motif domain-containing protein n=1 Tax=Paramicrosporidium saccamoebae TaxID=1246581 RepID=A0A2H9TIS6_9FUNG|nr:hypothetical protein PSACC_02562 [Paramicrosporidium saccamoebae]